jgi:DNA-binding NarL/FixJ family response regulator
MARILIADDRDSMRSALRSLLTSRDGWMVCGEAQDAAEALAKATELLPDVIVMDFKMHGCDGLSAASKILQATPSVPIILFTLYKTAELEAAAKSIGVRCVIGKEDGVPMLMHAIETQLGYRRDSGSSSAAVNS